MSPFLITLLSNSISGFHPFPNLLQNVFACFSVNSVIFTLFHLSPLDWENPKDKNHACALLYSPKGFTSLRNSEAFPDSLIDSFRQRFTEAFSIRQYHLSHFNPIWTPLTVPLHPSALNSPSLTPHHQLSFEILPLLTHHKVFTWNIKDLNHAGYLNLN